MILKLLLSMMNQDDKWLSVACDWMVIRLHSNSLDGEQIRTTIEIGCCMVVVGGGGIRMSPNAVNGRTLYALSCNNQAVTGLEREEDRNHKHPRQLASAPSSHYTQ